MECTVCDTRNDPTAVFCRKCTAPLGVMPLSEVDAEDRRLCLDALWRVLGEAGAVACDGAADVADDEALWRAYLSAFWLRPETALWLYGEALAVRSLGGSFEGPRLDLGCGDGVHSALLHGWRFGPTFDVFSAVDPGARDLFDGPVRDASVMEPTQVGERIAYGADIKASAVERARRLGVFEEVVRAEAADLPFASGSVGVVFSNMVGQLGDGLPGVLAELGRVLRPGGKVVFSVLQPAFSEALYFQPAAERAASAGNGHLAERFRRLGRGRHCFERVEPLEVWEADLRRAGFEVRGVQPMLGRPVVRFWDVGLRPFSTQLMEQARRWREGGVLEAVKRPVVAMLDGLLRPLRRYVLAGSSRCACVVVAERGAD